VTQWRHAHRTDTRVAHAIRDGRRTFEDAARCIGDEAWDVDHYWHEHPELKKAKLAWLTDFVGWVPMPANGPEEAFLTTDYNAEMIEHVERHPGVRDCAIFVGSPEDIVPLSFGQDLPQMRDWVPTHFDFSGYITLRVRASILPHSPHRLAWRCTPLFPTSIATSPPATWPSYRAA
jgi:hypothetical protein